MKYITEEKITHITEEKKRSYNMEPKQKCICIRLLKNVCTRINIRFHIVIYGHLYIRRLNTVCKIEKADKKIQHTF